MKCIKIEEAGIDICVSIKVKPIFMQKGSGDLKEELERLETARMLTHLGVRKEISVAQEIVREFEQKKELQ